MKPSVIVAIAVMIIIAIISLVKFKKGSAQVPEIVQSLLDFAEKNGSLITQFDELSDLAIGVSQADLQLFFLKMINDKRVFAQVSLREIKNVFVNKTTRRSNAGDEVIDTVAISLVNKDKAKCVVNLEFYNLETDSLSIYGELQLAIKWEKIISDLIAREIV